MAVPILEARALAKIYPNAGSGITVFKDITLCILPGELVVITGASGAGKTTLLNILGCLDKPSAGQLLLNGIPINSLTSNQLAHLRGEQIGFVFQQSHLIRHMTALENVLLPFVLVRKPLDRELGLALLTSVGLRQRIHHKPAELSGGEQQRVAIARALVRNPSIILADEPTGNLDHQTGSEIISLLIGFTNANTNKALVIVTHQPEIITFPHRRLHLIDGQLVDH